MDNNKLLVVLLSLVMLIAQILTSLGIVDNPIMICVVDSYSIITSTLAIQDMINKR